MPDCCPNRNLLRRRFVVAMIALPLLCATFPCLARAQEKKFSAAEIDFFEKKIRPLLVKHCLECHGDDPDDISGGLRLTSRGEMLKGGDSGPALISGNPGESLLISVLEYDDFEMPPSGQLDDAEIDLFRKWIKMGAPDPRKPGTATNVKAIDLEQGRKFWAFQPVKSSAVPKTKNQRWPRSDIDRWILARLEKEGIQPVARADRTTLIRRAYLTLIGLPPTIKQIDEFVRDPDSDQVAFAKVVDELLASRHFGERWGRHWLDVVRFAESSGGGRSLMFKDAWRFRDYVIDAYNEDRPFDQFIREQIAGDLLPWQTHEQRTRQLIGTGMLALGPTNYEQQDKALLQMEVIDEQIDTIGRAFLGLTLGCARCHDHKFDPIPTSDYYALVGIFKSTETLVHGNVSTYVQQSIATEQEAAANLQYRERVNALSKQLDREKRKLVAIGGTTKSPTNQKNVKRSAQLKGIVVDDRQAKKNGTWKNSTSVPAYVDAGYVHDENANKGMSSIVFEPKFKQGGIYEVRMAYSPGGNRASNAPVTIDHQDGKKTVTVNQSKNPPIDGLFVSLGKFRFEADNAARVTISTKDTDGHVIADAIQFIPQFGQSAGTKQTKQKSRTKTATETGPSKATDQAAKDRHEAAKGKTTTAEDREIKATRERIAQLDSQLKRLKKNAPRANRVAMSVKDSKKIADSPVHIRGGIRNLGPVVPRGFVSVCDPPEFDRQLSSKRSGRFELADWIASEDHPLTARVYVNRIWRHLFGVGLVATTENFGAMGNRSTHPELLDHLANQLIADGWSTKKLIRRIMLSQVYQLSSDFDRAALHKDDQNRLYWRANRRRLDVEVMRDSILATSGKLDRTAGGLTIRKITQYDLGYKFNTVRRSIYVPAFRNSMLEFFEVFDFANPNLVVGHRNTSTLPTQALFLMNSPFVIENAKQAAIQLLSETEDMSDQQRIKFAFRQTLGRPPSQNEIDKALNFIRGKDPSQDSKTSQIEAYSGFYHALFASLDFRYMN